MDFSTGIRRKKPKQIISNALSDLYPHDLQLFIEPPYGEIPLSEFEDLAVERLQLLRLLEQATHKGHKTHSDTWIATVKADIKKENLQHYKHFFKGTGMGQTDVDFQARRADHISHFILRLAYCRSEDLRKWFLAREQEWFKLKFLHCCGKVEAITKFVDINKLSYSPISEEEKDEIRDKLQMCTVGVNEISSYQFYKVPFTEVCGLVKNRRVFVSGGSAYIPNTELVTCLLSSFRAHLSEALALTFRRISYLDDERLTHLLNNLHTSYVGEDYETTESKDRVDIAHLDRFSKTRYPLCMRHIHDTFRATHHMKHGARLQYALFLKGIGVVYEDALRFWEEEFTKLIDGGTFDKKYTYSMKHMYGKVGRMVNYAPYNCMKIISGSIGPGDQHGCPFKHFDANALKFKLREYGISVQGIQEILELSKKSHYDVACSKYFELTHGQPSKKLIAHPNSYYEESIDAHMDRFNKKQNVKKSTTGTSSTAPKIEDVSMETESINQEPS